MHSVKLLSSAKVCFSCDLGWCGLFFLFLLSIMKPFFCMHACVCACFHLCVCIEGTLALSSLARRRSACKGRRCNQSVRRPQSHLLGCLTSGVSSVIASPPARSTTCQCKRAVIKVVPAVAFAAERAKMSGLKHQALSLTSRQRLTPTAAASVVSVACHRKGII